MRFSYFILFFILLIPLTTCQYPFPKLYDLILNQKVGKQATYKEIVANEKSLESIILQKLDQGMDISTSFFTKQKVPLHKGLNLKAIVDLMAQQSYYKIIQKVINIQEIMDMIIWELKNKEKNVQGLQQSFNDIEIKSDKNNFEKVFPQQINLQIKILENGDDAELTFKIGTDNDQYGPTNLKLVNFRQGLCLSKEEALSAFVGFSSSQGTPTCKHTTSIKLFKMVENDCGCPLDDYFPLKDINYKKEFTSLKVNEDFLISIDDPKICSQCEDYKGQERDIYLLVDHMWKIKGKKQDKIIEFYLPFIHVGNDDDKQQHLLSYVFDEISFGHKSFFIVSDTFMQEKWAVPFPKPQTDNKSEYSQLPLSGFSNNKTTKPPNIPPLDNKAKAALNEEKFYQVDVYSRPIMKGKEQNSLIEYSNERIKIDSIKNAVENSDKIVKVKEWTPTKEISIQTDKYELYGQSYEYEIKNEKGSLIQLVKTQPEIAIDILYNSVCYGNYCSSSSIYCKKTGLENPPPISALDKVCKEQQENILGKASTLFGAADEVGGDKIPYSKKIAKAFLAYEIYYLAKAIVADCGYKEIECALAKQVMLAKFFMNNFTFIGKIGLFLDVFAELDEYFDLSKLGKWAMSKFTGDPHITNLDGCKFDFQGQGDFVLLEEKMIGFAIHTRFLQHSSFEHVTTIRSIAIRAFWGAPIVQFESLLNEKKPLIRVNGLIVKIKEGKPFELPTLRIRVLSENYFIECTSSSASLQITNHGYGFLWTGLASIPAVYSRKLQGILGNGDSEDNLRDFQPGNNAQSAGYEKIIKSCKEGNSESFWQFGQSWRLTKKEDSILFYKKEEDPNTFFDKSWKPISSQEIKEKAGQSKLDEAKKQCQQLKDNSDGEEDFQNCVFDMLLFQSNVGAEGSPVFNAYKNSKAQLQEEKIYLVYKNVNETSAELEFGINSKMEKFCSSNKCSTKILYKKEEEQQFKPYPQLQNQLSQKTTQSILGLDKNTLYAFKVQIGDTFESNLVNIYTLKDICLPFCAKQNACGDDGCGGQCVQKAKCSSECKFGICEIEEEEENTESSSNTLKIVLISLSIIILIIIIILFIFFCRRKMLKNKQQPLTEEGSYQTNSSIMY